MTDDQINEALVDLRRSMHDGTAESAQRLHKRHDELLTLLVQRAVDTPQTMTISDWTAVIP